MFLSLVQVIDIELDYISLLNYPSSLMAGPAGLMCAYNLSQAGVAVRVVDRKQERLLKGQADVIQVRGIEILDVCPSIIFASYLLNFIYSYIYAIW